MNAAHFPANQHPAIWDTSNGEVWEVVSRCALIRDNGRKYGQRFDQVAAASGIRVLRMPIRALRANAVCERCLGSVRRECLDYLLILGERQLARVLKAYVAYFNQARRHQGIGQARREATPAKTRHREGPVRAVPVLGDLAPHV